MTFFGKNIKKIRSIKGLSQQAFAEHFDLKRGTLGAYEEGRSEPKLETVIKIANYFSISLDSILTNELTVNQLLRFKGNFAANADVLIREQFTKVPCITLHSRLDYISNFKNDSFINDLPAIEIPLPKEKKLRGLTVFDLEMTDNDGGFYPGDIVVGEFVTNENIKHLQKGTLIFALAANELMFRRIFIVDNRLVLKADHKGIEDKEYDLKDIKELWEAKSVFLNRIPDATNKVEERLLLIEQEFEKLKERLGE